MFGTPTTLVALTGAVLLVASTAPVLFETRGQTNVPHPRADQLERSRPKPRSSVALVEIVGLRDVRIILRGADGALLFLQDPTSSTTMAARDADLPMVFVTEEVETENRPGSVGREPTEPASRPGRRAIPAGCEGSLSPLAQSDAQRVSSLCLASLDADEGS
jgi:hypothetical protein